MTKSQSATAFNTSQGENQTAAGNSNTTFNTAQGDIGDYEKELSQVGAENPFQTGGSYQTAQNQQLASTAAAGTQQAQQAAQAAAVRSGINPSAAIAAGTATSQANTRAQLDAVSQANQNRISQDASYKQDMLKASAAPASLEAELNQQELGAQGNTLGQETDASKTPSFWQELGQGVIQAGTSAAKAYAGKGCWIAARLYGGWNAREVAVLRLWFAHQVSRRRSGRFFLGLYRLTGAFVARELMPRSPKIEGALRWLFDQLWLSAQSWTGTDRGARILGAYDQVRRAAGYDNEHHAPMAWLDKAIHDAGEGR